MGIRFRKSIKLGDLVKINISKSGISATVGKKGASVNIGGKGTYLNLSPAIAGITGTGVSYRKKITGGFGNLVEKISNKDKKETDIKKDENNSDVVTEYENSLNESINVHKLACNVINEKDYELKISNEENDSLKEIYTLSKNGDEETIETLVGSFISNFDFTYPIKANYELEENELYVDLDLPEIEDFINKIPHELKDQIKQKKSQVQIKEEYAKTILSLSIYLSAEFFNLSSYIKTIIISGYTTRRNNDGDLIDEYLYSIKYSRDVFESTDLSSIEDAYNFILKFENRINLNVNNYSFKAIKPYEQKSTNIKNSIIEETISALKTLGYKNESIEKILPELNEIKCENSGECLKQALKLLSNK